MRDTPLMERYRTIRAATEWLCQPLATEDYVVQSMPDASPAKWHLAHTSWFFETFVLARLDGYRPFDPQYEVLFNSYYNAVGEQFPRPRRGLLSRPTVEEVYRYRHYVDQHVLALMDGAKSVAGADVVELGLHHEQQHQELLLTDVKHLLSCNPLRPVYRPAAGEIGGTVVPLAWIEYPAGVYEIGHTGGGFAFDNESPRHRVFLESFALGARLVTNGEFLAFIDDGGYQRPELWLSDGWDSVRAHGWHAPLYWEPAQSGWRVFTLSGTLNLNMSEPVCHVSYYEADAYARWAGARLPREAEWEVAAVGAPLAGSFVESELFHPAPLADAVADEVPAQLFGEVWQWTQSPYTPYPGYQPPPGALGEYNAKFMSSQIVLRGASCATPRSHARVTYRNFFPPSARWQFMGLRLARDLS
ncbi:MAG TPA: ergothioneine biosynthesis protein EgtB [Candidatus Kryptonia bacterium]|nr:ergothioneine biosynthesis protein EgtB [Candidatus Kryptonia bacterium]